MSETFLGRDAGSPHERDDVTAQQAAAYLAECQALLTTERTRREEVEQVVAVLRATLDGIGFDGDALPLEPDLARVAGERFRNRTRDYVEAILATRDAQLAVVTAALEATRDHILTDMAMQTCDGTDSCWYCFCANQLEAIDAAIHAQPATPTDAGPGMDDTVA